MTTTNRVQGALHYHFLTFPLGPGRGHRLEILSAQEVVGLIDIIEPSRQPFFHIMGAIEFRGQTIPLMDLRCEPERDQRAYDERSCIIVVEWQSSDETNTVGMVVESICV